METAPLSTSLSAPLSRTLIGVLGKPVLILMLDGNLLTL